MASGSKVENAFTRDPGDKGHPGSSEDLYRTKGGNVGGAGTMLSAYPMDNVHGMDVPDCVVEEIKMAGSDTNLSHSLKGASAVIRQTGKMEPHSGI